MDHAVGYLEKTLLLVRGQNVVAFTFIADVIVQALCEAIFYVVCETLDSIDTGILEHIEVFFALNAGGGVPLLVVGDAVFNGFNLDAPGRRIQIKPDLALNALIFAFVLLAGLNGVPRIDMAFPLGV